MLFLLITFIILLSLLVSWIRLIKESKRFNVKGPLPLPLLGNAHLFVVKSSEFLSLLNKLSLKYGDAFRVYFFLRPYVMISHPKYVEPLASSTEHISKGRSYTFLEGWLGNGLLTSTGQRWKTHRKFLTPAFHFNILQNFLPVFCKNQRIFTEKLRKMADGRTVDLFPMVALAALDSVTESIMGVCLNVQTNSDSEYLKAMHTLSRLITMRIQVPILGENAIFNLTPMKKKQDNLIKYLHSQTNKVIETRREELKKANITRMEANSDVGMRNKHAFLDLLLLPDKDGKSINEEAVREEVDTFMFEGHDTTTSGIVYSLFCLSRHRDVQEKIYEELKTIFGDDMYRDPTYHELHQMKYLELVIKESMRLFPPVPIIERRIERDCEVGDLQFIKGTSVMINIFRIHRRPDLYEDPLVFKPERFETPLKNAYNFLAFSAGPRNCIGQKFAMMKLKVSLSEIVKHFIILPTDQEPELNADLVLRSSTGVHVKFRRRI